MARNPKQRMVTKKHLARLQREERQRRFILIGAIIVVVLVLGLIGFGLLEQYYLSSIRPVADVNGERITTAQFQAQARYTRQRLINNAVQSTQLMQYFGDSAEMLASIQNQIAQIQAQLDPQVAGQSTLDQLIDDALIRQEAKNRGITVSQEEIDQAVQEGFGFFPSGTPTPAPTLEVVPTSTLNPAQLALVPPTPTATAVITATETLTATQALTVTVTPELTPTPSVEPSVTPTQAPTATATPYTLEGFQTEYNKAIDSLKSEINFSEKDLRYLVEMQLYREKLQEAVLKELNVSREQEQAWVRHLLVADEGTAKTILERLNNGEDWATVVNEVSTDQATKSQAGDLGWNSKPDLTDRFSEEFANAAFELATGQVSQPVQSPSGWHLIQGLGHETRTLPEADYQQLQQTEFQTWLTGVREKAKIETFDRWQTAAPVDPTLPPEITQLLQQQVNPAPLVPTEAAVP